jgi:hypothetical protein
MTYNECVDDFAGGVSYNGKHYNKLKDSETKVTIPSNILFANGVFFGPTEMDENGNITSLPGIKTEDIIKSVIEVNPSIYIKENQELAKSVKHILITPY